MLPRKTDQARTALQAHRAPLDMRQRRLLILCDGQRDLAALTALIGPETPAMVIQLVQAGYLLTTPEATPSATGPATAADAGVPISIPPASPERRRSLAAARIYLLGILEMQRHPQAATLLRGLQLSRSDGDVVLAMQSALLALPTLTSVGYAERVRERLLEVMPTEHGNPFGAVAA
ncbi:hypothetical protein ICJ04_16655 [Stenotrophomonas sp. 169]|uniref:hypothetical protein n=1 Tax=unclassified Stenotrophomonas TaxID=196198 RepID=UPI00166249AC|nr:hypothetical protein [Stenotrophomonas sp. 169]QNR97089.1 hypothetical protein ICJ04_16655 [Stenotrophomonas sp. 169]